MSLKNNERTWRPEISHKGVKKIIESYKCIYFVEKSCLSPLDPQIGNKQIQSDCYNWFKTVEIPRV